MVETHVVWRSVEITVSVEAKFSILSNFVMQQLCRGRFLIFRVTIFFCCRLVRKSDIHIVIDIYPLCLLQRNEIYPV